MTYYYPMNGVYPYVDLNTGIYGFPGARNKIVRNPNVSTGNADYPAVDPTMFNESAIAFQELLSEASLVLENLAESKEFASKVMDAAQKSDTEKVKELIESTGIHSKVDITYNPDGIKLGMSSQVQGSDCCKLQMSLRWR